MAGVKILIIFIFLALNLNLVVAIGLFDFIASRFFPSSSGQDNTTSPSYNVTTSVCNAPPSPCPTTRYRSLNGSCNNLENPGWGTPNTTYGRLIASKYSDGISRLPRASSGRELPNVRRLSIIFFPDKQIYDMKLSLLGQQWGQTIAHDMSFTDGVTQIDNMPIVCCENGMLAPDAATDPFCAPVIVPLNDPIHRPGSCLDFVRTLTARDIGCAPRNKPAEQLSVVTAYMDVSILYGSTDSQSTSIRTFTNGHMRTVSRNGHVWPPQVSNVTATCAGAQSPMEPCYLGGDDRINQNTQLTMLQVMLVRIHNRIADDLRMLNPQWDDERTYQESRRIVIAVVQNINYYEYLPLLLGEENMIKNKLIYPRNDENMDDYINDYNPEVNPAVLNEHATAAYRYFHSLIRGQLEKKYENRTNAGELRLSDWFNRPKVIETNNNFDDLVRGMTVEAASASDQYFDKEITEYLFRANNKYGGDLRSVDIQRARDHGLGSYVSARAACNFTVPRTFNDLRGIMSNSNINKLQQTYENINDVDLALGGAFEYHVQGALAGPTFLCIITTQFYRTRVGDRFFFENGSDNSTAFTRDQLKSIRQGGIMARILCDTSDVTTMQRRAFEQISEENAPILCDDLPNVNITLWKE